MSATFPGRCSDAQGGIVYDKNTELAHVALPPGDYSVEARYGSASFSQNLTLLEANRLMVSFVLEVGGIRVLPRVQGLGLTSAQTQSLVYALSGADKGKLITISKVPGEILRVKSGDYRIESRFATGNAVAVVDVHVNSGVMSAVEIDHAAGLARLSYVGAPDAHVSWLVTNDHGEALPAIDGLSASVVLKPGAYIAKAQDRHRAPDRQLRYRRRPGTRHPARKLGTSIVLQSCHTVRE